MIATLFVQPGGCYWGLPEVDPWDESRDARLYAGPWPVVAHPPCARWCQMAGLVEHRYGLMRGDDGGCFEAALRAVQRFRGVLEHPAYSLAWPAYGLPVPQRGSWQRDLLSGAWVTEMSQVAYGHRARKRTWLYACVEYPPVLDWSEPDAPVFCENMCKRERSATPATFRDLLLSIARSAE